MTRRPISLFTGHVVEDVQLSFGELCRACGLSAEQVYDLIDEGIIEPIGRDPARWRFSGICIRRIRVALRLQRGLGVNPAGAALALDLMDEIERMRIRLRRLER